MKNYQVSKNNWNSTKTNHTRSILKDISSISGSDTDYKEDESSSSSSDEDDDSKTSNYSRIAKSKPKITFKLQDSTLLVMHRVILHGKKVLNKTKEY